jgi:sugar/nucleoside kinase (ribokinase family)
MSPGLEERSGILCAGTIVADIRKVIDIYPVPDHVALIEEVSVGTGGAALNMAVDLRLLGARFPISVAGAVGADAHGDLILRACADAEIGTNEVQRIDTVVTSFTDAMVERKGGRRTFFHHPGANGWFDASLVDLESSRARILHCGAPGIHELLDQPIPGGGNGWSRLLERGRAAGLHTNLELVSLEPARMAELVSPCLPHLDTIIINELEAAAIMGTEVEAPDADDDVDWATMDELAAGLIERGVSTIAIVHFPAGCVAATPTSQGWRQGSVRLAREQVADTTGAGDAFAAGAMLGVHDARPVQECLRLGVVSAAACIRTPGTSNGIASVAGCLADAERAGFRPTGRR